MSYITDYHYQWTFAIVIASASLLWHFFRPRFGKIPTAFLAYALISCIWVWSFRDNRYVSVNPYDQTALRYFTADSLLKAALVIFPLSYLSDDKTLFYVLGRLLAGAFAILNSLVVITQFLFLGCDANNSCGGLVGNPSISLGLTVCMLPLIGACPIWALVALAVLISKSSIAVGLLAIFFITRGVPCVRTRLSS